MSDIEYKLFFDNKTATREQLDEVEEITVEQEMDMAWEARIEIPICVNEKGTWRVEDEDFMRSFSRVRVEIKIGDGPCVPLIDGPIIGFDNQKSTEPGQSSITLIVHDDSVYLNRKEHVKCFEELSDHQIVKQLFEAKGVEEHIPSTRIEEIPGKQIVVVQRGTAMQLLRSLAKCHERFHAYVLPGDLPGQSIGVFKAEPTEPDGLLPLVLLGSNRNLKTFDIKKNALSPSIVRASTLRIGDKGVVSSTASFRDSQLLGAEPAMEDKKDTNIATHILSPYQCRPTDSKKAVKAKATDSSYAFEATGSVLEGCYPGVLQPYRLVEVKAGGTQFSGDYLITRVTHSLTRSTYSQSFSLERNAQSERSNGRSENHSRSIS